MTGCGDEPVKAGVAKGCTLNSDCKGGLVCSFGLCHQECEVSDDCPAGQRCLQTDQSNVCQLEDEAQCHFKSDCQDPLVCAIDLQCRNQCQADEDCLHGQTCADGVCAEPEEVSADGMLKGAVGAGGEGGGGNEPGSTGGTGGTAASGGSGGSSGGSVAMGAGGEGGAAPAECVPGGECVPDGQPCQVGMIACSGGVPTCEGLSEADDGTDCGTDQVCSGGDCVACKSGQACDPDGSDGCVKGSLSCANGPSCDVSGNVKNGTGCGNDKVCSGGSCVDCVVDEPCDPAGQACKNGKTVCSSGPACQVTTNKSAGTSCGTNQVCDSAGSCAACVQNGPCEPSSSECHVGTQDCSNGPNCTDTGVPSADGLACTGLAAYNYCTAGVCAACAQNNPCVPANPCHKGTLNCSTTPPTCNDSLANAVDGLACGASKSCLSGQCLTNDRVLTVTSGAVADVAIDAPFSPVTVHLVDGNNSAVQGAAISVTASAGAYALASAVTNAQGNAQITGRVGRAIGSYKFTVSAPGATPIEFNAKGVAANAKDVFTLVNVNHVSGTSTVPGAGTLSKLYYDVRAVAAAKDGTLYVASYCAVYKLTPAGVLSLFAGSAAENCGFSGDSGLATQAKVYNVSGLALDETNGYLYLADYGNGKVRQVDLATNQILTFAGGGVNQNPYGDGGPADAAYMSPTNVGVAPNGDVYISDNGPNRIRKVDANTGIITSVYTSGSCSGNSGPLTFTNCFGPGDACSFAWDSQGQLFISAYMCGGGQSSFRGVARVEADKSLSQVAGTAGSATPAEGGTATSAVFSSLPNLAFDKAGNLYLTTRSDHRVRRIDALSTKITTVAGTGTAGDNGDYLAGNTVQVNYPTGLAIDDAGHLYFGDAGNYALRTVYGVGAATSSTATLATTGGTGQTVKRDAPFAALTVKLTDASNAAISGANVTWKRLDTGSGLGSSGATTTTTKTNGSGTSAMTGRVGLASGDYKFEASYTDIHGKPVTGSPQSFTVKAADPNTGDIFAFANYVHVSGTGGYPGPATFAKLQSYALGVVAASDGSIYYSDSCAVYKTTSRGEAAVFAGTPGSCSFAGDSGPAVGAKLYYPEGMALDETNGVLYIADNGNQRVRMVSLQTGIIDTFAGGDSVSTAPYGDGGPAVNANIGSVTGVSVGPNGLVYIPDYNHNRIRVVDPNTGVITTWLAGNTTCVNGTVQLYSVAQYSAVRFKSDGTAFIGANFCQGINTSASLGVARRDTNGTMTRIAGLATGSSTSENIDAVQANFPDFSDLVIDGSGNLLVCLMSNNRVRRIDMSTGKISTVVGDGTAGYAAPTDVTADPGAYVPASGVRIYYPFKLALWPGDHLLVADQYNYAMRMIW